MRTAIWAATYSFEMNPFEIYWSEKEAWREAWKKAGREVGTKGWREVDQLCFRVKAGRSRLAL